MTGSAWLRSRHWDVHGGPDVASWFYRCERAGPSTTAWRTRSAGAVLHLRWLVDPARPWAGVSPLQHAADTGSLAGWLEKRLIAKKRPGRSERFCRSRNTTPTPTPTWPTTTPTPTRSRQLRRDIGGSARASARGRDRDGAADSPASAPRKDFQVARFGANPPRDLVELRDSGHTRRRGGVRDPARVTRRELRAWQSMREGWRQFIATSVDGLARRHRSADPTTSWASRSRLIPGRWAGVTCWRGRPRSADLKRAG